jgi:hypothetical protein
VCVCHATPWPVTPAGIIQFACLKLFVFVACFCVRWSSRVKSQCWRSAAESVIRLLAFVSQIINHDHACRYYSVRVPVTFVRVRLFVRWASRRKSRNSNADEPPVVAASRVEDVFSFTAKLHSHHDRHQILETKKNAPSTNMSGLQQEGQKE